jgi:phosphopantetheinyl transferase
MFFYIGLSLLSSVGKGRKKLSSEGRRIVSLLDYNSAKPEEILYEEGGRPYFENHHADFSISHSRKMTAASLLSFSEGTANVAPHKTGCDIQYIDPKKSCVEISHRFFHDCEQLYIENDPIAQIRNFYRIWVLKEAWLKLHGFSVFEMAKSPAFSIGGEQQTDTNKSEIDFFLYELSSPSNGESYMLASARQRFHCSEEESEPEIRWFSDTTLTLKRVENIYAAQSPEKTVMPNM